MAFLVTQESLGIPVSVASQAVLVTQALVFQVIAEAVSLVTQASQGIQVLELVATRVVAFLAILDFLVTLDQV